MRRGFFPGSQTAKMINSEHVLLSVWFHYFFSSYILTNHTMSPSPGAFNSHTKPMSHKEGINACEHFLRTFSHNTIPTGTLCNLIRMILTMNNFSFNDNHYLQIHGTAMRTKMVPSYANLFLFFFSKPTLWKMPHFNLTLGYAISMIFL